MTTPKKRVYHAAGRCNGQRWKRGQLAHSSYIRPQRLFTIEQRVILYSAGKIRAKKLAKVLTKAPALFS
jgi:hypothetical protein